MTKAKLKNALDSKETKDNKPDGVVTPIDIPQDGAAPGPIDKLCTGVPAFLQADEDTTSKAADTPFGRFTWTIPEFSKLQSSKRELRSHVFSVGSYKWYILVYPKGCDVCNHLSLFLCVAEYDKLLPGWHHFAQFTIAVVNQDPKKSKYSDTLHRFCKKEHDWGWKKFLELSKINDGFITGDTLTIKAQVQVIIDKPGRPFACLYPMYRRELLRVYLSNVEGVCKRFCDDKRARLAWLNDPAFHNFWKTVPSDRQKRLLSERSDIILKGLLKQFFSEKEVITTLVMDALFAGCCKLQAHSKSPLKVGQSDSQQPMILVSHGGCTFNLHANVANLPSRLAAEFVISLTDGAKGTVASDTGRSGHEGDMSSTGREIAEHDETRLIELGSKAVQMFVIAHICTEKIEVSYREAEALRRQDQLIAEETLQQEAEDARRREQALRDKERRARKKERQKQRKDIDKLQQDTCQLQTATIPSQPAHSNVQQPCVTGQTQQPFNLPSSSTLQPPCENVQHPTFGTFANGTACLLPPSTTDNEAGTTTSNVLQPLDTNSQPSCSSGSLHASQPASAAFVFGDAGANKHALPNALTQQPTTTHLNQPLQPALQFGDVLVYSPPSVPSRSQHIPTKQTMTHDVNDPAHSSSKMRSCGRLRELLNRTDHVQQQSNAPAGPDQSLQQVTDVSNGSSSNVSATGPVTETELVVLRQQVDDLRQALLNSNGVMDSLRVQVGCLSAELHHEGTKQQQQQQQGQQQLTTSVSSTSLGKQDGSKKRASFEAFSDTEHHSTLQHHHTPSNYSNMHRSTSEFSFCKPSPLQRQFTAPSLQPPEHHHAAAVGQQQACISMQRPFTDDELSSSEGCRWSTSVKRGLPYEGLRPLQHSSAGVSYGRFGSDIPVETIETCHNNHQLPLHHSHGMAAAHASITSTVEALFPSYRNAALNNNGGCENNGRTIRPRAANGVQKRQPCTIDALHPVQPFLDPAQQAKGLHQELTAGGNLTSSSSSEQSVLTVALDTSLAYSDDTLATLAVAPLSHDPKNRAFCGVPCAVTDTESSPYEFAHMGIIDDLLLD